MTAFGRLQKWLCLGLSLKLTSSETVVMFGRFRDAPFFAEHPDAAASAADLKLTIAAPELEHYWHEQCLWVAPLWAR